MLSSRQMAVAREIQPIGLRGTRRASTKPTTPNGIAPSASPPLTCGLCLASTDSGQLRDREPGRLDVIGGGV